MEERKKSLTCSHLNSAIWKWTVLFYDTDICVSAKIMLIKLLMGHQAIHPSLSESFRI